MRKKFHNMSCPFIYPTYKNASNENKYKIKVVVIGNISVGKTSLAQRFAKDTFENGYKQTIGASFFRKTVQMNDDIVTFQIWDTAGQERYKSLVPMYIRGAQMAFVVYDVSDVESFYAVNVWLDILHHSGNLVRTMLVANKCDLECHVDQNAAMGVAEKHGVPLIEASAKSGHNVETMFLTLGTEVLEDIKREIQGKSSILTESGSVIQTFPKQEITIQHKKCCKQ